MNGKVQELPLITPTPTDIVKYGGTSVSLGQKTMANSMPVTVASDQTIMPFLSDISYHNNRGELFNATWEWTNVSTSEKNLILIRNPNGSGKNLKLLRGIFLDYDTVASFVHFHIYAKPTVTGTGTALTINNGIVKTSPNTSVMNLYRDPTTSALGSMIPSFLTKGGTGGSNESQFYFMGSIIIEPNNDVLITGTADGTNRDTGVYLEWAEI